MEWKPTGNHEPESSLHLARASHAVRDFDLHSSRRNRHRGRVWWGHRSRHRLVPRLPQRPSRTELRPRELVDREPRWTSPSSTTPGWTIKHQNTGWTRTETISSRKSAPSPSAPITLNLTISGARLSREHLQRAIDCEQFHGPALWPSSLSHFAGRTKTPATGCWEATSTCFTNRPTAWASPTTPTTCTGTTTATTANCSLRLPPTTTRGNTTTLTASFSGTPTSNQPAGRRPRSMVLDKDLVSLHRRPRRQPRAVGQHGRHLGPKTNIMNDAYALNRFKNTPASPGLNGACSPLVSTAPGIALHDG